jgi:hypothetical protein
MANEDLNQGTPQETEEKPFVERRSGQPDRRMGASDRRQGVRPGRRYHRKEDRRVNPLPDRRTANH